MEAQLVLGIGFTKQKNLTSADVVNFDPNFGDVAATAKIV